MKIEVSNEILHVLEEHVKKEKKFPSVQEYVHYLLQQVADKLKAQKVEYSKDEEEKVAKRLRDLGYID